MADSPQPLRVLLVEDNDDDAELLLANLRRGGYAPEVHRVLLPGPYRAALAAGPWDVIIADYALPGFSGLEALAIHNELRLDLPFILVSGTVGEEVAVESMRAGAHDYLLKDRLTRLVPVVRRELRESRMRAERHQAEAALRESEERHRLLVENSNDLILEITRAGLIHYASPNHLAGLGFAPAELVGGSIFDHFHPDDRPVIAQKFHSGDRSRSVYRLRHRDGSWHWLESSGRAFFTSAGEERIVVITRDISEQVRADEIRRHLEAQLRQSQKMEAIGTLAGGIAHDFNNILTGILGNVQLAQFELPSNHPAMPCLADALTACARARDLVSQILTFSRRRELQLGAVQLGPVIQEALNLLRASIPSHLELRAELDPATLQVLCDPTQIHQIVMNLGANAAHAMGPGGVFTVTLESVEPSADLLRRHPQLRPNLTVRLTLRDTGCGMDAGTLERIFEPFFTTKGVGEGTGLGLAVVHGIVQALEGAVVVESAIGAGTCFQIYLPGIEPSAVPLTPPPRLSAHARGRGQTILVVDDEAAVIQVAERALQLLGYQPVCFSTATAAINAVQAQPARFEAIITDLTMPELSGIELVRIIQALRPDLPVIITTGNSLSLDPEAARLAGVRGVLEKPFSLESLALALERALPDRH